MLAKRAHIDMEILSLRGGLSIEEIMCVRLLKVSSSSSELELFCAVVIYKLQYSVVIIDMKLSRGTTNC